jgi:hypothetical protein
MSCPSAGCGDHPRKLVDKVVLTPVASEEGKSLSIDLHGHLAGILSVATKPKGRSVRAAFRSSIQNWLRGPATTDSFRFESLCRE